MKIKRYFPIIILTLLSFIPLINLFHQGLPITHDGQDHVARIANFYQNILEGNIIPRWAGNLNWGYGHPILMFLYPLPSYTASLFHLLGFSLIDSTKIVFGLAFLLSGLAMYLWIKNVLGIHAGIAGGILYMFAPYRFVDLYVRGAIGEHVAFIFPPLICYFIFKLSKKYSHMFVVGAGLSVAGLLLSHNAISIMFFPLIFLYAIYLAWKIKNKKYFIPHTSYLILLGLGLSAFFWLPAFFEGKYTLRDIVTANEYSSRFSEFKHFIFGEWSYGGSGQLSVQVGILHWLVVVLTIPSIFILRKKKSFIWIFSLTLFLVFWIALFLMTSQSKFVWDNITVLQKFQFPWRLLSIVVFVTAALGGVIINTIPKKLKTLGVICFVFFTLILSKDYWHANGYLYKGDSFFSGIYNGTTDTGESSPIWSVRFMEKRAKVNIEAIDGKATIREMGRKTTKHAYKVFVTDKTRFRENTLYFPGWSIIVDGKPVPIEFQDPNNRGLMTFYVPKGEHVVFASFGETKLRHFADIISLITIVSILGFLGFNELKNKV